VFMSGRKDQPPGSQTSNLWASALRSATGCFLNCPTEEVEGELAYWRDYWKKNVEPLPGDVPPWEWVLAGYYTRTRNPARFAKTYIAIAKKVPRPRVPRLDGGQDGLAPEGGRRRRLAELATGVSPAPPQPHYSLDIKQLDAFFYRLNPQTWAQAEFPLYPYDTSRLVFPPSVLATGYRQGQHGSYIEALAITGKEIWFGTPARGSSAHPSQLLRLPLGGRTGSGADVPVKTREDRLAAAAPGNFGPRVGRPARRNLLPAVQDGGRATLWIGTSDSGLARFDRAEDGWPGTLVFRRRGMPVENVSAIAQGLYDGKKQLLLEGHASAKGYGVKIFWVLDPATASAHPARWS